MSVPETTIDAELARAGLRRSDIFMAQTAIAGHRSYLAHMLSAWSIDVARAVDEHWEALKLADQTCAECSTRGRCRWWLQEDRRTSLASVFCPNAQLLAEIAHKQRGGIPARLGNGGRPAAISGLRRRSLSRLSADRQILPQPSTHDPSDRRNLRGRREPRPVSPRCGDGADHSFRFGGQNPGEFK
jgi:hypothetical protein